jgi:hypothetical protein
MNFFDHKGLGNHLLQLCPKVVKHPVYCYCVWRQILTNCLPCKFTRNGMSSLKMKENQPISLHFFYLSFLINLPLDNFKTFLGNFRLPRLFGFYSILYNKVPVIYKQRAFSLSISVFCHRRVYLYLLHTVTTVTITPALRPSTACSRFLSVCKQYFYCCPTLGPY